MREMPNFEHLNEMSIGQIIASTPPDSKPNMLVGYYVSTIDNSTLLDEYHFAVEINGNEDFYTQKLKAEIEKRGL